jgi:SRSO17 transposase
MTTVRTAHPTVRFVDGYCEQYRELFTDVRSYEYFTLLHVGLLSPLPRKSLPAVGKAVGLTDGQGLHHLVAEGNWDVEALRERRLEVLKAALGGRSFVVCIDETGDPKKGKTTDYAARQYLGKLGKVENGVVSVNAYGVLDDIPFPLVFRVFKPERRLKAGDGYRSKPQLAIELLLELRQGGFVFHLVLADRLYGESGAFIEALEALHLEFVVAIRDNHGVWMLPGERVRQTRWRPFLRTFSDDTSQTRYLCEIIFGKRGRLRYFHLTTDPRTLPPATTCLVMTNLSGNLHQTLGDSYGLRTWIEYGFKHIKNELGWADYRLTDYAAIERWWEMVFSAYLLVSLQSPVFAPLWPPIASPVLHHPFWEVASGWKHTLNNLRLLLQPFLALHTLLPWLSVFAVPHLARALHSLIALVNSTS